MKKLTTILFGSILISFLFLPYLQAKEPETKKEVQTRKKDIKQKEVVEQTHKEAKAQNQNPIEKGPELMWQRDFGSEIRRFKLHKTIDPSDFPILAVETEEALNVFDKKGNEKIKRQIPRLEFEQKGKKEFSRGFAAISDNGEYVLEGKGIPEFSYDLKYTTVDGKTLWEKKHFYGQSIVSPDGSTIVLLNTKGGKNEKGSVEFYSGSGKLLKQHFIDLFSIGIPLYKFSFSGDGNYCVLRLEQWIEDKKGRRAIYPVILFDKKGNLLWQKKIEVTPGKTPIFELLISPHGNIISYSSDKYIYSVDNQGNLLWKKQSHGLLVFSDKGDLLIKGRTFSLVDSLTGKEIRSFDLGRVTIPFMVSPIISPDEALSAVVTAGETIGDKYTIYVCKLLEKEAKIIFKREYSPHYIRKIQFSRDSKNLYFVGQQETKLSVYRSVFPQ